MCSQCFTLFAQRNPPLSCSCPHCDMAHFCNRLCLSKATTSAAHHPLLCPGQNKAALDLLYYIHSTAGRHLEAVAKIIARWRGEREWGDAEQADRIEQRVWNGMARVNMETKEMERKEWCVCAASGLVDVLGSSPASRGEKNGRKPTRSWLRLSTRIRCRQHTNHSPSYFSVIAKRVHRSRKPRRDGGSLTRASWNCSV